MESTTGTNPEVSDSQCIAAEARVTVGLVNNVDNVNGQNTNAVENHDSADENIHDFV